MSTIHSVGHGLVEHDPIYFGNLVPSDCGIAEGQVYYVLASPGADDFTFSETDGGAAFTLALDITEGIVSHTAIYTPITDPDVAMAPPVVPGKPATPTLTSSAVSGVVRMEVTL
jgi:hypothetical protein